MADMAEWRRRVAEWRGSGLTAAEFCRSREFAASTLRWYSSRLGADTPTETAPVMIQVRRAAPVPPASAAAVVVEIGGAIVRVPEGANEATLAAVFAALRSGAAR